MSKQLRESAGTAVEAIDRAFADYARRRTVEGVGQFLDDEGCAHTQYGLYGVSIWLLCNAGSSHVEVVRVRADCIRLLRAAVDGEATAPAKHVRELNTVVPKMAYACSALYTNAQTHPHATKLLERLTAAVKNGGWGFSTTSARPNVMATALAVRLLRDISGNSSLLDDAIKYLRSELNSLSNPYARLYVL